MVVVVDDPPPPPPPPPEEEGAGATITTGVEELLFDGVASLVDEGDADATGPVVPEVPVCASPVVSPEGSAEVSDVVSELEFGVSEDCAGSELLDSVVGPIGPAGAVVVVVVVVVVVLVEVDSWLGSVVVASGSLVVSVDVEVVSFATGAFAVKLAVGSSEDPDTAP